MYLLRFLLLPILLPLAALSQALEMDLDFVAYDDLTQSQSSGISQSCSGKFVDNFKQYSQSIDDGSRIAKSKAQTVQDQSWILEGNAMIIEKSIVLLSDSIQIDQISGQTQLNGQSQMRFDGLMLQGDRVDMDLSTHTGTIKDAKFVIHGSNVNGEAQEIRRDEDGIFYLKNFTISRCNPDQRSWHLKGTRLKIDPNTGMITSVNNWLWIAGVPILPIPYIHMPFDDHATGGLLVPTWAFSNGKLSEFNQPIYFRFKPNLDMTTTVSFLRQSLITEDELDDASEVERTEISGWLINNEVRFLGRHHEGQLLGAYSNMPSQTQENSLHNIDRYYYKFQQKWYFDWFTSDVELNGLSDVHFFQDFYAGEETRSVHQIMKNKFQLDSSTIYQTIDASWALERSDDDFHKLDHTLNTKEAGWDLYFKQQWQILDSRKRVNFEKEEDSDYVVPEYSYLLSPGIEANYKSPSSPAFKINQDVSLQLSNFDLQLPDELRDTAELNEQLRMAGKATYSFPMQFQPEEFDITYKVKPSLLLQGAMYPGWIAPDDLDSSYLAGLATFSQSLDIPIGFNETQQILIQPEYIRQLAPFVDTSYLPDLDTAATSSSYANGVRFSGMDRFGDVDQASYGIKFSLQENKRTHAQFGVKQRRFFAQEMLQLNSIAEENLEYERLSDFSVQASFTPDTATSLTGQWDYSKDWLIKTQSIEFKYTLPSNHYIRLTSNSGFRAIDIEPTQEEIEQNITPTPIDTELLSHSLSLSGQWALNHQVGLIGYGKWQYDLLDEEVADYQFQEMAVGVEYDDCCWAFRMLSYNNFLDEEHEDNKLHFQIIFKGMGRIDQGFDTIVDKYLPAYPGSLFEQD